MPTIEQRKQQENYLLCMNITNRMCREGILNAKDLILFEEEFAKMFHLFIRYSRYELEHNLKFYSQVKQEK